MNNNFKNSGSADVVVTIVLLLALAVGATFFVSPLMFIYPLPVIILTGRRGFVHSMLALAGADIIIVVAFGPVLGSIFAVVFTSVAVVMAWLVYRRERTARTVVCGAGAFLLSFVAIILLLQAAAGVNFISVMTEMLQSGFDAYIKMAEEAGQNADVSRYVEYMRETLDNSKAFIGNFFPSMIICMAAVVSSLNYFAASRLSGRFSATVRTMKEMKYLSFPRSFIMAMAVLLLLSYGLKMFNANYSVVQLNILSLCYMGMLVQGLAVLKFFLARWGLPKALRAVIIVIALLLSPLVQVLTVAGMLDMIFDLRKLRIKDI